MDGPDCFMDRVMNANICPLKNHQQLVTDIRGINSPTSAVRHFLMQSHHVIKNNNADWITMVTASPGVEKKVSTNLVTFQANQTYLVTSPPGEFKNKFLMLSSLFRNGGLSKVRCYIVKCKPIRLDPCRHLPQGRQTIKSSATIYVYKR